MGAYLKFKYPKAKDKQLEVEFASARRIAAGESLPLPSELPADEALVCVVFNDDQNFDAAAVAYDDRELARFHPAGDRRRKKWYVLPRAAASASAGLEPGDFNTPDFTARPGTQNYAALRALVAPGFSEEPVDDLPPPWEIVTADSVTELLRKAGIE
jgi:hypothetical protein